MIKFDDFKLNKDDFILIGVSGGSDSMSLLDMIYNLGYKIVVCHVNYHKRDSALRDQKIVEQYCATHSIDFHLFDCFDSSNNFQDYARDVRYNFFKKIYDEYNCQALMLAHQLNDKIETYLFKKNRNSIGRSLSIEIEENIYGMRTIRPLLDIFKIDLEKYCATHSIKYGVDETNLSDHYSRNKIRHNIVDKMDHNTLNELILQMNDECEKWNDNYSKITSKITENTTKCDYFEQLSYIEKKILVCELINQNCPFLANNMKGGIIDNIISKIQKDLDKNIANDLIFECKNDNKMIVKNDDKICCVNTIQHIVSQTFNSVRDLPTNIFEIRENDDKKYGINLKEEDFPLTLRSYTLSDFILLKDGKHQKVNRLFINKKIPIYLRNSIPLLVNKNNEILFIYGLYRRYSRKLLKNNVYMLKYHR